MLDSLINVIQRSGITVKDVVSNVHVSPLSTVNSDEMQDGVATIDLGGGVTDVTVCYGGKVRYMSSIPIGAQAIDADIRSYSMPEKYVEDLKIQHGYALVESAPGETITFQRGSRVIKSILSKNLATIIAARLSEIAEHVRRELRDSGYSQKLSAGAIITGGAAQTRDIEKLFARVLGVEVRVGYPEYGITPESIELITTPAYSTAVSLLIYGAQHGECAVVERNASRNIAKAEPAAPERDDQPAPQPKREEPVHRSGRVNAGSISVDSDFDSVDEEPVRRDADKKTRDDARKARGNDRDRDFDDDDDEYGDVIKSPKRGWLSKLSDKFGDLTRAFENPAEEEEHGAPRSRRGEYGKRDL
ncbi:MAG: rod shape-determining protein [Alistipes sp.]|nr:rod shape-determining protein [Alistipes sp.]